MRQARVYWLDQEKALEVLSNAFVDYAKSRFDYDPEVDSLRFDLGTVKMVIEPEQRLSSDAQVNAKWWPGRLEGAPGDAGAVRVYDQRSGEVRTLVDEARGADMHKPDAGGVQRLQVYLMDAEDRVVTSAVHVLGETLVGGYGDDVLNLGARDGVGPATTLKVLLLDAHLLKVSEVKFAIVGGAGAR